MDIFLGISVAALACTQASQALRNLTTNEMANWYRYKYRALLYSGLGSAIAALGTCTELMVASRIRLTKDL